MGSSVSKRAVFSAMLIVSSALSTRVWAGSEIYVQASKGSFNNEAIDKLFEQRPQLQHDTIYAGTPLNVLKSASENHAFAFSAVDNTTINGKLVQATVTAFEQYKPTEVIAYVTMPIEMCVLMNKQDVQSQAPITLIASHPAALKQIDRWKQSIKGLAEQEIPAGTAEAARKVAQGEMPKGTAAIGSCALASLYPTLSVVQKGVQDNKNNATSFLMMKVAKRDKPISEQAARHELNAAIAQGKKVDSLLLNK